MGFLTLIVLITIAFFLIKAVPGGPFDSERALPKSVMHNLEEKYGTNKPLLEQYFLYFSKLFVSGG